MPFAEALSHAQEAGVTGKALGGIASFLALMSELRAMLAGDSGGDGGGDSADDGAGDSGDETAGDRVNGRANEAVAADGNGANGAGADAQPPRPLFAAGFSRAGRAGRAAAAPSWTAPTTLRSCAPRGVPRSKSRAGWKTSKSCSGRPAEVGTWPIS